MIKSLEQISERHRSLVGGKAFALSRMLKSGIMIPPAICIGADAYREFVMSSGIRERVMMELNRKAFEELRWEEIWDVSLRVRNLFSKTNVPARLGNELRQAISSAFGDRPVTVRSSAPGEDSAKTSFAGLHESYVNVRGAESILEHVRLVWASLWSDRALLYRRELGLDIENSSMAVVIQELVVGERSGVAFGMNPNDDTQAIVEAVYGLNQGLVDGAVEPDSWIIERESHRIISHSSVNREKAVLPSKEGVLLQSLSPESGRKPPLNDEEVNKVFTLTQKAEQLFNAPQDVEWTFKGSSLYALQARPITTHKTEKVGDQRSWYLSLTRSFENLKMLRERIEMELIPAMIEEADRLASIDISRLSDSQLAEEINQRLRIHGKWENVYKDDFIPFAHGARLFGQVYSDKMHPSDPYEFTDLLKGTSMVSVRRNGMLVDMAEMIRKDASLAKSLEQKSYEDLGTEFSTKLEQFLVEFGDFTYIGRHSSRSKDSVSKLLLQMASQKTAESGFQPRRAKKLAEAFISRFEEGEKAFASELLDLARVSYQLRDDDNIYIGRVEGQMHSAVEEGKRRIEERGQIAASQLDAREVARVLIEPGFQPSARRLPTEISQDPSLRSRQIVGQPSGPGIAVGKARVIINASDLFDFEAGEILVCDAIDPNMTFVVPLSAAVVERRGGMLIHGAIIAREYGLPCVTGVPNATSAIRTGDEVTVDGFLGIVIIGKPTIT
jgi:pyruvate,water dikinase